VFRLALVLLLPNILAVLDRRADPPAELAANVGTDVHEWLPGGLIGRRQRLGLAEGGVGEAVGWPSRSHPAAAAASCCSRSASGSPSVRRRRDSSDFRSLGTRLNNGAPRVNATREVNDPEGGGRGARSRSPWEEAAVLIHIWIERVQPLAGTAVTEGSEPLRFDGWLELLRVASELVAAAPMSGEDADTARSARARKPDGDVGTPYEPPAHQRPAPGGAS
jgi:hypothetical protein